MMVKNVKRWKKCIKIDIFNESFDPFVTKPEESEEVLIHTNYESKTEDIKRLKIIKMLTENKGNSEVLTNFSNSKIIEKYIELFLTEKNKHFLVTFTKYINFTNSKYPLDIKDYIYHQVFLTNYYGFVNFTKIYPIFIDYEINKINLLLVCILEHHNEKSSINDINYFLYSLMNKIKVNQNI